MRQTVVQFLGVLGNKSHIDHYKAAATLRDGFCWKCAGARGSVHPVLRVLKIRFPERLRAGIALQRICDTPLCFNIFHYINVPTNGCTGTDLSTNGSTVQREADGASEDTEQRSSEISDTEYDTDDTDRGCVQPTPQDSHIPDIEPVTDPEKYTRAIQTQKYIRLENLFRKPLEMWRLRFAVARRV